MSALLELSSVAKRFGGLIAVDMLSFDVAAGEIVGLIGPNGSGKTTALNLVSGAIRPDAGAIRFGETEIAGLPAHRIARLGIARTFQLVRPLPGMSAAENVIAGLAFRADPLWGDAAEQEAARLLVRIGLGGRGAVSADRLTYIDQKRLELARALALQPKLLLLDEWLAGLNPTELEEGIALVASLRGDGLTVIMVEHVISAIRALCDRCVVMNAGAKIAEGTPEAVLKAPEVVEAYLGTADA